MGRNKKSNNRANQHKKQSNNQQQQAYIPKISQQQLQIQCLELYQLLINKTKILKQEKLQYCYLISTKWLQDWKQYVGYYNLQQNDQKKHKKVGKKHPGKINYDLTVPNKDYYNIPQSMSNYQYLNTVLSEKKQKDDDYIPISQQIWKVFTTKYDHIQIKRPKRITKKGTVNYDGSLISLQTIFVDYLDKQIITEIQNAKQQKKNLDQYFPCDKLQFSNLWSIDQLYQFIQSYCQHVYGTNQFKIWKGQGYSTVGAVQRGLWEGIHPKQQIFQLPCRQLKGDKYKDLDLDNFLKSYHFLVIQIGKSKIYTADIPNSIQGYCQECVKKKILNVFCLCQQMFYCSQECRTVDQVWHSKVCKIAFDSEDDQQYQKKKINFQRQDPSISGLVNLGNTCYMNSVIQGLLSITDLTNFFTLNNYSKQIDPKQFEQNKGRLLTKFSKTCKRMIQEKQALSPWSLKGQINYFISPFNNFKQHDANDFLINFVTVLNQQLKKEQNKNYHQIFENNLLGQFNSLIKCPECTVQISNDQIFTQISLPIKQKAKKQIINYIIYENKQKVIKGKCFVEKNWQFLRKNLQLDSSCLLMATKEGQNAIDVNQDQAVDKAIKKLKRQLIFYPNVKYQQEDQLFSFITITEKYICGQKMKSPYGYPAIINLQLQLNTLGSFWVLIVKQFCSQTIYSQAQKIIKQYEREIEQTLTEKKASSTQSSDQTKQEQNTQQQKIIDKILQKHNNEFKQLLNKNKIKVFINDLKRNRNICAFCKKKCNGCQLPIDLSYDLKQFIQNKQKQINFQILLPQKIQQQKIIDDKVGSCQTNIHDCMELFTQYQQLDEENAWYCSTCENMRLAYKQLTIKKIPKILIIHLNRFKNDGDKKIKNSQPVQYKQIEKFQNINYQLISSIIHEGSTEGGHYWAICKRNNKYYIFNDSKVCQTDKICNKNAYILIYRQIQNKK